MTKKATGINLNKISNEELAKLPRPAELPYDNAVRHIIRYANVFRTQNLASVFSVMSDVYYHTVSSMIQGFNRIGIRKELYFSPYPKQDEDSGLDYTYAPRIYSNGKAEIQGTTVKGDYAERYTDSTTGTVLYSHEKKNAEITVLSLRSPERDSNQPIYCESCGMEVQTSGELFICKGCGATYRSDSYDWVTASIATPMAAEENKQAMSFGEKIVPGLMYGAEIATPVLAILGLFAGRSPLIKILIVLGCLYIPAAACYIIRMIQIQNKAMMDLAKFDPLASTAIFAFRTGYLINRMYNAHDHNPGDMRTMMAAEAFAAFAQVPHSGNFVLDVLSTTFGSASFYVRDGRQCFDVSHTVKLLVLTRQRQAVTVERPLHMVFYRNEHARYEKMLSAQKTKCTGCGQPLDLTAHAACKFCGIEYDVADFDWKIAAVDATSFA